MSTIYSTKQRAIQAEIIEALGEYADRYDIDAVADQIIAYEDGAEYATDGETVVAYHLNNRGFYCTVEADEFWELIENHTR